MPRSTIAECSAEERVERQEEVSHNVCKRTFGRGSCMHPSALRRGIESGVAGELTPDRTMAIILKEGSCNTIWFTVSSMSAQKSDMSAQRSILAQDAAKTLSLNVALC